MHEYILVKNISFFLGIYQFNRKLVFRNRDERKQRFAYLILMSILFRIQIIFQSMTSVSHTFPDNGKSAAQQRELATRMRTNWI